MNHPFFRKGQRPLVIAHRGDVVNADGKENTRASFQAAYDSGADGIELDVFLLADNNVIVFHDEDTERLTGVKGDITKMTLQDVRKLSIKGEPVPTLEEILTEFKDKLLINVEMKAYRPMWERRETGTEVAKVIRKCKAEDSVIVTSFDPFMLWYLEREYEGLHSGFAYDDGMEINLDDWFKKIKDNDILTDVSSFAARYIPGVKDAGSAITGIAKWLTSERFVTFIAEMNAIGKLIGSTVVDIEHTLIDDNTIEKFHKKNMSVGTYTFFSTDPLFPDTLSREAQEKRILELAKLKVDWIETDDPAQVKRILEKGSEGASAAAG